MLLNLVAPATPSSDTSNWVVFEVQESLRRLGDVRPQKISAFGTDLGKFHNVKTAY